jgi:hypothetical protein
VAVEGITVNLPAAPIADVQPQTLPSLAKPLHRMHSILTKTEVFQPGLYVALQAFGIDFLAMSFQKALQ